MKIQLKSLILGFAAACGLFALAMAALFLLADSQAAGVFRDQRLPSGRVVKATSFHLTWGGEHGERLPELDEFALEYVSAHPDAEPAAKDAEALEVFELIRPISELWGFDTATLAAFRAVRRKGVHDRFRFRRSPEGSWSFTREQAKVFIDD